MTDHPLRNILARERELHPGLTEQDVYKLVSQAVFGGDHLLDDLVRFASEFTAEWFELFDCCEPGTEILQVIDPDGHTARLHLLPLRSRGFDPGEVISFLTGQEHKKGQPERFRGIWENLLRSLDEWDPALDHEILSGMPLSGLPGHHSDSYGFASYRICNDIMSSRTRIWLEDNGIEVRLS